MSLDETFDRMQAFARALDRFSEAQATALAQLEQRHAEAEALWRDQFARDYAARWEPLAEGLKRWTHREAPAYRDFMRDKLGALSAYLEGDR